LPFDSHNGRVFKLAVILACALVVLAGCSTTSRRPAKKNAPPADWNLSPTLNPEPKLGGTNPPAPAINPLPAPLPGQKTNELTFSAPETTWLSFDRWAREHGFEKSRRTGFAPAESFALSSSNGVLTLRLGSLSAGWDGIEFRLGFAPQLIHGQLFVHALDLWKNIEPLLHGGAPLATTDKVIVLDPGHGGSNTGARSAADGRNEKTFTLDWALRTAKLLEEKGWRVFLTRTNDADVSLADRITLAEAHKADLFLSLHFNSSGGGGRDQAGLETYCLTPAGMPSSLTRGYDDNPAQSFPNNAFDEQNFLFALQLHRALLKTSGDADRGVRRARFLAVLRGQNRPAVLIEGGYLSNSREARRIGEAAYRQKLAEAVAEAVGKNSDSSGWTAGFQAPSSSLGNTNAP
jgi:N-acetylmuramoyl-L-alanine amidase